MGLLESIKTDFIHSLSELGVKVLNVIPKIFGVIVLLLIGWLIAKLMRSIVNKMLTTIKLDQFSEKIGLHKIFNEINLKVVISKMLSEFVYWIIFLMFVISASEAMGMTIISDGISSLIAYLPQLLSAIFIFVGGILVANLVKKSVVSATNSIGLSGSKVIGGIVFYVLAIFISITALNQAGIDTSLITSNVVIVMGAILLAFGISYGFASRDILTNILSSFYSKERYTEGMIIKINDIEGTVVKVDTLTITIKNEGKKIVIPVKKLISETIEIIEE
tara:strand:- start:1080 stop:1910 length:831 start_codon:yes stop_codon:yes gene_type:complete